VSMTCGPRWHIQGILVYANDIQEIVSMHISVKCVRLVLNPTHFFFFLNFTLICIEPSYHQIITTIIIIIISSNCHNNRFRKGQPTILVSIDVCMLPVCI
jgi:hypothetical protein